MSQVRLLEPAPPENGAATPYGVPPVLMKPLRVSGVVVEKADLIEALRVYLPRLSDLQVTEDGERYWLLLDVTGEGTGNDPATP